MSRKEMGKLMVTMPPDVKQWLEQQAAKHLSSQSSEAVRAIRRSMEAEAKQHA